MSTAVKLINKAAQEEGAKHSPVSYKVSVVVAGQLANNKFRLANSLLHIANAVAFLI